ncbi:MAG: hypothetical protein Q8K92_12960 [Leadbetterella sp.]|nr:hypothetical protein [Leadbetterella sp.]
MIRILICNIAFGAQHRPRVQGFLFLLGAFAGVYLIATGEITFIDICYFIMYALALMEIQHFNSIKNGFNEFKKKGAKITSKDVRKYLLTETYTVNMIKYNIEILQLALPKFNEEEKIIIKNILSIYEKCINAYNRSKDANLWFLFRVRYIISYSQQLKIKHLLNQIKNENI